MPASRGPRASATPATPSSNPRPTPTKQGKKRKLDPNAQKYYAVRTGAKPGVYLTWPECQKQTSGFRGAQYKSFLSREDAEAYVAGQNPLSSTDGVKDERFYAVAVGRDPGIYTDWETAALAIKGWKGPKYRRFDTRAEAIEYIRANGDEAGQKFLADRGLASEPPSKKLKPNTEVTAAYNDDGDDVEHVYTDGSSRANGTAGASAGVGVFFGANDPRNVSERLKGEPQTNQRAELTAILRALEKGSADRDIRIFSDSKYSISCVTEWYKNWEKNNWKTKEGDVKNRDLVEAVRAKIDERSEGGMQTYFQWVKGHAANEGNAAADLLAVKGAKLK